VKLLPSSKLFTVRYKFLFHLIIRIGTAPDIAGQNKANPTALLLSGTMMLRHLGFYEQAERIQQAALDVIREGKHLTGDLGGKGTTTEYTDAIIQKIQ
jgi:isocitrate dehydrogenase (NAD+)